MHISQTSGNILCYYKQLDFIMLCCLFQVIVGSHKKVYGVRTPYKKIVKCIRYRNPGMLARSVLKVPAVSDATKREFMKIVRKESALLCTKGSLLRVTSAESLLRFKWSMLAEQAEKYAPTLTSIVTAIVQPSRNFCRKRASRLAAVGTGLAVLLHEKCHSLCLPQTLNSIAMYAGHSPKQVSILAGC